MTQQRVDAARRALEAQRIANIAKARKTGNAALWIQSVWTIRGDRSRPYSMKGFEFLDEILAQQARSVSLMACSGVGKTEIFIPWALSRADRGRRVLYFFENDTKTSNIVQERVNPNFHNVPYLVRRNRGEADNIHLKKLGPGICYFLGLNTDAVTRTYHGDDAIYDEFDAMAPMRVIDIKKRLSSSTDPTEREISNPSHPDMGIHARYKEGDMRRWHVECAHCGGVDILDYLTHLDRERRILACWRCRKPLVVAKAFWKPTNPKGKRPTYHIHGLMRANFDAGQLCDDLVHEDWRVVSSATRMDLGLPYEDKESGLSDADLVAATDSQDRWSQHAKGGLLICDPGGVMDCQLWSKAEPGIPSRCVWVGTVAGWRALAKLAESSGVAGGFLDYGPDGVQTKEFCEDQENEGRDFKRISYTMSEKPGNPDWAFDDEDRFLIQSNRTSAIDTMILKLRKGELPFPKRVTSDPLGRWATHMKSPRRITEITKEGKHKTRWHHEETRPDHQFHVTTYASIGLEAWALTVGAGITVARGGRR